MLGSKIWMIIPFGAALNLTLMIPGQPTTILVSQVLFCGFCTLLVLLKRLPIRLKITELEIWVLLILLCVGQAYLRNPVGLNIFGGESIGARPYFICFGTLITFLFLSNFKVKAVELKFIIILSLIAGSLSLILSFTGYLIPEFGVWFGAASLAALNAGIEQNAQYGVERATRIGFFGHTSKLLALSVSSFKSPIMACFHPLWAPLVCASFAFAAFSGYRNEIAAVGFTYLVGIAYRGGIRSLIIANSALIVALIVIAFVNAIYPLPANIQRSLSFVPGTWDEVHVKEAQDSTAWRVDMWKDAILTEYWIKNKLLGDGLGITQQEYDYIQNLKFNRSGLGRSQTGKLTVQQEYMMATNSYHSGPVSTIRTIGYLGLLILLAAQIRLAVHAHRLIKKTRNTEWFPTTLFVGIPLIWSPIFFVFIYGEFGTAISFFLLGAGMIRLLQNSLESATIPTK